MKEGFWEPDQALNYFNGKNFTILTLSLTRASNQWQVLETVRGLKTPGLKNPALEVCSLLQAGMQAVKSRARILLVELLLSCHNQSGAGLLMWFFNQLKITTVSRESALICSMTDWLVQGRQLRPCVGCCASTMWPGCSDPIVCVLSSTRMCHQMSSLIVSQECLFNPF